MYLKAISPEKALLLFFLILLKIQKNQSSVVLAEDFPKRKTEITFWSDGLFWALLDSIIRDST